MRNRSQKGFAHLVLLLLIIAVAVGAVLLVAKHHSQQPKTSKAQTPQSISSQWSNGQCQGKGTVPLTNSPISLNQLDSIAPMGNMVGDHVTPSDHLGFASVNPAQDTPIYAVAKGYVVQIEYTQEPQKSWYGLLIEHSCTFYSRQFLLSDLAEPFKSALGNHHSANVRMPVAAGQLIGSLRDHGLDYWLADLDSELAFINPDRYANEAWKIHIVDPFNFYAEPLKSQLLAKDLREATPRGGSINYDAPGSLAGNWFKAGSQLTQDAQKDAINNLTFGYDFLDPRLIRISLGDYQGKASQFNAADNGPDPQTVKVGQLVKYGLVGSDYRLPNGQRWDRMHAAAGVTGFVNDQLSGTMMVQLVSDRQLKLETFPGQTPASLNDFTSAARIYER